MSKLPLAGMTVQIIRHSSGSVVAYLEYHLDIESGLLARSGRIQLEPIEGIPGSKEWAKDSLVALLEHL